MKIVHLISTFPPYKGGMGNVCLAQVKELAKLGHQVCVFVPGDIKNDRQEHGFKVKHVKPLFKYGNAAFVPGITKGLKDFDVIHLHWPFFGGAEVFLLWYCLWGQSPFRDSPRAKLIVQYHMDPIAPGIRGLIFKLISFLFNPLFFKKADKILISSFDYLKHSNIKKYWLKDKEKFIISFFGVDQVCFYPKAKRTSLLSKHGLENSQVVLFVGGLDKAHYFKGVNLLIQAIDKLKNKMPDLKLLIVGDGDLRLDYEKLVKELNIENKVVFAGKIGDNELPDYYNLADVFAFPSLTRSEAFGLVSLEAMACAKPIIVSDLPGPRTLVESNGLIVKVNNLDDLAEKIHYIFKDKQRLREFGQRSLILVQEKYYWPQIVKEIEKIYVQAID
ncbi:glycosyltransferase family 4 protein [Patescibacteria group bacterium]|nr:glycosyltransferase family 4 protein [Patescibacteria group bacterium]